MASRPRFNNRGEQFWKAVENEFVLSLDEHELLIEVCRMLDRCEELHAIVQHDGMMVAGSMGQDRLHPAIPEVRQCTIALGRLLAQLELESVDGRVIPSQASTRGRAAAAARWGAHNGA